MAQKSTLKYKTPPPPPSRTTDSTTATVASTPFRSERLQHQTTPDPAEVAQVQHAQDMHRLWVGPMPVKQFIDDFLGRDRVKAMPKKATKTLFRDMPNGKEDALYFPFMERVQTTAKLIPGFKLVDTSNHADRDSRKKIRPDPTLYRADVDLTDNTTRFEGMELHFEFKRNNTKDPFEDPRGDMSEEDRLDFDIEPGAKERKRCRGQICSYVIEWMSRQHRLFAFTIYIGHPWARFIRWDRAGAIVSEKFSYVEDARPLNKFLWRFVHVNDTRRGLDPTVRYADPEEIRLAKTHLTEWQPPENNPRPILVMGIPVTEGKRQVEVNREFIVWGSMSVPDHLTGRSTRGYPALEKKKKKLGFLKDTWRAECVEPESKILNLLQENNIPNIPPFYCGGDLPLPMHQTLTDLYAHWPNAEGSEKRKADWRCGRNFPRVTRRIHHRFVVNFIGKKLTQFQSSRQLLKVVLDAFIAHQEAYEKCSVIHRDISIGNILISADGNRGILIDWDLAISVKPRGDSPRSHERTGTWQFMSSLLLQRADKPHTIQDDMESFIYVVLFVGLRHLPHNRESGISTIMKQVFDSYFVEDGKDIGGNCKNHLITKRYYIGPDFAFTNNGPLNLWLDLMLDAAKEWIEYSELTTTDPQSAADPAQAALMAFRKEVGRPNQVRTEKPMPTFFSSHSKMRDTWALLLERKDFTWPENDWKPDALKKIGGVTPSNTTYKRRLDIDEIAVEQRARKRRTKSDVFSKPAISSSLASPSKV